MLARERFRDVVDTVVEFGLEREEVLTALDRQRLTPLPERVVSSSDRLVDVRFVRKRDLCEFLARRRVRGWPPSLMDDVQAPPV